MATMASSAVRLRRKIPRPVMNFSTLNSETNCGQTPSTRDPEPSLTLRGGDRRIRDLQCSTILAEDDCDRPSNQPRNVCADIPNTYGRCRGLSSLRGGRLAAIARV